MKVWIDNDACPKTVRELVFRAADRLQFFVTVVGNSYFKTTSKQVEVVCVPSHFDAADSHIVAHVKTGDLVITGDIPLAGLVIERGAVAISAKGDLYDASSIGEKLALRNLRAELRSGADGLKGGPRPYSEADKKRFSACFDRMITKLLKN